MNRSIVGFVWVGMLATVAGCASTTGRDRSAATVGGIAEVRTEIARGLVLIDATTTSLNDLAGNPRADLREQYNTFAKQVDALDDTAKRVASRNQAMKAKAQNYFNSWENDANEMKSEQIKSISAERRSTAKASFDQLAGELANGKAAFTPLMDELRDIQQYLSNDLTTRGVAACKPIADLAGANAVKVKESLNNVIAGLARVEAELSPASPPK